jgi:hypothetical protein
LRLCRYVRFAPIPVHRRHWQIEKICRQAAKAAKKHKGYPKCSLDRTRPPYIVLPRSRVAFGRKKVRVTALPALPGQEGGWIRRSSADTASFGRSSRSTPLISRKNQDTGGDPGRQRIRRRTFHPGIWRLTGGSIFSIQIPAFDVQYPHPSPSGYPTKEPCRRGRIPSFNVRRWTSDVRCFPSSPCPRAT